MLSPKRGLDPGTAIEPPTDAALGGVVEALHPQSVLAACRTQLESLAQDERSSWNHCRVVEALYHPGRYVRVAYAMLADDQVPVKRNWPQGQIVYLHAPLRPPMSRRGRVILLGGWPVEAYLFPNDRRLRGLRKFASRQAAADVWRGWMREAGDDFEVSAESLRRVLIRYVPEQKWIVRLRVRGVDRASGEPAKRSIAVRCASNRSCAMLARRHRVLRAIAAQQATAFQVPAVVGQQVSGGLLATQWNRGNTLLETLRRQPARAVMDRVSEVLASFHALPVEAFDRLPDAGVMSRVKDAVADLALACPDLEADLRRMAGEIRHCLNAFDACRSAVLHNDFHWNQLRLYDQRCTLLDLERMCSGDPLIDAANFAAQLRMLAHRPEHGVAAQQAADWADAFLNAWSRTRGEAIEPGRFGCFTAMSLLELARGMMRHLRPGWRLLARTCIESAAAGLGATKIEAVLL